MMRPNRAVFAAALLISSVPVTAAARVVDYSLPPEAIVAAGEALQISPLTREVHPHTQIASIASKSGVDHVTLALGLFCSAYKVENPVSQLLEAVRKEWNDSGDADQAPATTIDLTIDAASSYRRCVEVSEMNVRCITKVKIAGTATRSSSGDQVAPIKVSGEIERDASVGGFCGNLAKGVGVVSREAALALFADAEKPKTNWAAHDNPGNQPN